MKYRYLTLSIRLFEKILSFYKEVIDEQHILFYVILLNYVRCILFRQDDVPLNNIKQKMFPYARKEAFRTTWY